MARIKGKPFRRTKWQTGAERQAQIRTQLAAGEHDPATIARAIGLSKEAVMYHAAQMSDLERVRYQPGDRRWRFALFFRVATAAPVTGEVAAQ